MISALHRGRPTSASVYVVAAVVLSIAVGIGSAASPRIAASALFGLPALVLLVAPTTRFAALLAIVVLAPISPFVKAFTGTPTAPLVLDLAMIGLTFAAAVEAFVRQRIAIEAFGLVSVVVLLLGLVQMLNPTGPGVILAAYGYRFFVLPLTGYLVARSLISTPERLMWLHRALLVTAVVVAIYGLHQAVGLNRYDQTIINSTIGDSTTYTSLGAQRIFSTTSSPAHLAYFMACGGLLVIARFVTGASRRGELLVLPVLALSLLLTIIRTAWYGFGAGLLALLLALAFSHRRSWKTFAIAVAIVLAVILSAVGARLLTDGSALAIRLDSLLAPTDEAHYTGRVDSWISTIGPAIVHRPWGYGTGSDSTAFGSAYYAHNGYLYVAIELGLPGLLLALWLLGSGLTRSLSGFRNERRPLVSASLLWAFALIVATLVEGLFGSLIEVYPVNLYLWLALGAHDALRARTSVAPLRDAADHAGASAAARTATTPV